MPYCIRSQAFLFGLLLVAAGCGGGGSAPVSPSVDAAAPGAATGVSPGDSTSILKRLSKDVLIASTVDPTNGDTGPRAISVVHVNYGLKRGQLLVCNFADSKGTAGNGTTIDVFNPVASSSGRTFAQNAKIKGCAGDAVSYGNDVYGAGLTSRVVVRFNRKGKYEKTYAKPIEGPLADGDLHNPNAYSTEYLFVGDAKAGTVVNFAIGGYGNPKEVQAINGFATSGSGWGALGPAGMQYDKNKDVLYIVDGVSNTLVAVTHPGDLLQKDEITVGPSGKTFKCKHRSATCAKLVYAGTPLNAPIAAALMHNGNLIIANSGDNTLVEVTPKGTVLATKTIDQSKTPGIFGLAAVGRSDSSISLFYTDTNTNELRELTQ